MIVIPLGGLSKRFTDAGYNIPKYMLSLNNKTLFDHSVSSFYHYFKKEDFLFIALNLPGNYEFIERSVTNLGIRKFKIVLLDKPTKGQAETVFLGIKELQIQESTRLTIFNIDTFRPGFIAYDYDEYWDGYLEVFYGYGNNWSYVLPSSENPEVVFETAEKKPISNLCCTGLYDFASHFDFIESYINAYNNDLFTNGELYVAPLYNYLIQKGRKITYNIISSKDVIFCGVPAEYEQLKESAKFKNK